MRDVSRIPCAGMQEVWEGDISGSSTLGGWEVGLPPEDLSSYGVRELPGPQPSPPPFETRKPSPRAGALQQVAAACGQGRRRRNPPVSRQPIRAGSALSLSLSLPGRPAFSIPSCSAAQGQDGC